MRTVTRASPPISKKNIHTHGLETKFAIFKQIISLELKLSNCELSQTLEFDTYTKDKSTQDYFSLSKILSLTRKRILS